MKGDRRHILSLVEVIVMSLGYSARCFFTSPQRVASPKQEVASSTTADAINI